MYWITPLIIFQVREVLTTCLSQQLVETEEFKEALKLIQLMAREELQPILANVIDVLQGEETALTDLSNIPSWNEWGKFHNIYLEVNFIISIYLSPSAPFPFSTDGSSTYSP